MTKRMKAELRRVGARTFSEECTKWPFGERCGSVGSQMLTLTRSLSKPVGEYKASVAHRSAAVQLLAEGGEVDVGNDIQFVYLDSEHSNPLCRVRLPDSLNSRYDKKMYAKLAIETAKTVFSGMGLESSRVNSEVVRKTLTDFVS